MSRFWDMLHVAMWYRQKADWNQQSDFVQFGYLVVFLVMHVTTLPKRPLQLAARTPLIQYGRRHTWKVVLM